MRRTGGGARPSRRSRPRWWTGIGAASYTEAVSDLRGAFLTCPACGGPMAERTLPALDDAAFHECIACFGLWIDWHAGEASQMARLVPSPPGPAPARAHGGACPRDGTPLGERPYLDSGPLVERCPTCLGLFAARDQVAPLAAFHERIPVDTPEPIVWVSLLSRFWHAFIK